MEKICGIYKIENKKNHKVYIGQSTNIYRRWKEHRVRSQSKKHIEDNNLYMDMYEHLDDFDFSIIERCDRIDLNQKEINWIAHYNSTNPEYGYNISKGGQEGSGYTQLSDDKVLEIVMCLETTTLNQTEIANKYNVTQQTISSINVGEYSVCQDMDIDEFPIRARNFMTGLSKYRVDHKRRGYCSICGKECSPKATVCMCCNIQNRNRSLPPRDKLKFQIRNFSFAELGEQYGINENAVRKWCKKYNLPFRASDIKLYNDYEWDNEVPFEKVLNRIKAETPPIEKKYVEQVDMDTGEVLATYNSTSEARKALGVKKTTHIVRCCDGRKESYRGFIWRYRFEYIN